jgi:hypothetical protein
MTHTPHELSQHAIDLVAAWSGGTVVSSRENGYHVDSPSHGRLRVHARGRASQSLTWFHVPEPAGDGYDAVVLIEFDRDGSVGDAWKLSRAQVVDAAASHTTRNGKLILKIYVGGDWTSTAESVQLTGGGSREVV